MRALPCPTLFLVLIPALAAQPLAARLPDAPQATAQATAQPTTQPAAQAATQPAAPDQPLLARAERANRGLNLSEAQKARIQALRDQHHPDLAFRRDAARQARLALQRALQDSATSEAQLRALHDKASAAQFDLLLARRSLRQEVQAVLSPEQRAQAAERRATARVKRQERMRRLRRAAGMAG